MPPHTTPSGPETVIASIQNQTDPSQCIDIRYLQNDHVFVTHGIEAQFAEKEISIPGHLVVMDFQLMGAIVSEILEKLSLAREGIPPLPMPPGLTSWKKSTPWRMTENTCCSES